MRLLIASLMAVTAVAFAAPSFAQEESTPAPAASPAPAPAATAKPESSPAPAPTATAKPESSRAPAAKPPVWWVMLPIAGGIALAGGFMIFKKKRRR